MKNLFIGCLVIICMLAYDKAKSQEATDAFTITGKLLGLEEGEKVTMQLFNSKAYHSFKNYLVATDSAYVRNGIFILKGSVPRGPRRYYLIFDRHRDVYNSKALDIVISGGEQVQISSAMDIMKIPHGFIQHYVSITGSPTNYSRFCLEPLRSNYYQDMLALEGYADSVHSAEGFNPYFQQGIALAKKTMNEGLYYTVMYKPSRLDPEVANARLLLVQEFETSGHAAFWADVYDSLSATEKKSFNGEWMKEISRLSVGQPLPQSILQDDKGQEISLDSTFFSRHSLTLLQFCVSYDGNAKQSQEETKFLLQRYGAKGLGVVGIVHDYPVDKKMSVADNEASVTAYLQRAKLPWMVLVDTDPLKGPSETIYREGDKKSVSNVLIDAHGKIIGWHLKPGELQYYLWKTFGN